MNKKLQKGITLIALVITIIVLLILAGVSIATLTGDNGILTKTSKASENTEIAKIDELVKLAISASYDNRGRFSMDLFKQNLTDEGIPFSEDGNGNVVIRNGGKKITVNSEGKVIDESSGIVMPDILTAVNSAKNEDGSFDKGKFKQELTEKEITYTEDENGNIIIIADGKIITIDSEGNITQQPILLIIKSAIDSAKNEDGAFNKEKFKQELTEKGITYTEDENGNIIVTVDDQKIIINSSGKLIQDSADIETGNSNTNGSTGSETGGTTTEPQTYTITYSTKYGSAPSKQIVGKGETFQISLETPVRDCYRFDGWWDKNTRTTYSAGQTLTADRNYDLSADWEFNYHTKIAFQNGNYMEVTGGHFHSYNRGKSSNRKYDCYWMCEGCEREFYITEGIGNGGEMVWYEDDSITSWTSGSVKSKPSGWPSPNASLEYGWPDYYYDRYYCGYSW